MYTQPVYRPVSSTGSAHNGSYYQSRLAHHPTIKAIPIEASQTDRIGADIIMVWPPFTLYIHTLGKCMYLCLDPNRSSMIHTGDIASKGLLVQVGPCDPRAR